MATNATKGDVAPRETSDSRAILHGDGRQISIVREGLYNSLEDLLPEVGDASNDELGFSVVEARLQPRRGGLGRLEIKLVPTLSLTGDGEGDSTVLRSCIEVDYVQYERPLFTHKKLDSLEVVQHLQGWVEAGKPSDFKFKLFPDDSEEYELTESEQEWAALILRGVESYLEYAPVISQTRVYRKRPKPKKPGGIDTPPQAIAGYQYLKTGDRLTQNQDKSWTRLEQWTGQEEWSDLLYGDET